MSRVQPRAAVISPSETNANVESEKKPTASKQSGCHWPCRWRAKRVLFLLGLAQAFMTISICACVVVFEQFCLLGACDSESWLHLLLLAPFFLAVIFVVFVLFHECRKELEDGQPFDGVVDEPEEVFLMVTIGEVASLEAELVELSKRCEEAERRLQQKAAMRAGEDDAALMARALSHATNRAIGLSLNTWRVLKWTISLQSRAIQRALDRQRFRGWKTWSSLWSEQCRLMLIMQRVLAWLGGRALAQGWHTWWKFRAARLKATETTLRSVSHLSHRGLHRVWTAWLLVTQEHHRKLAVMQAALEIALKKELGRGMRSVSAYCIVQQRMIELARKASSYMRNRHLIKGWRVMGGKIWENRQHEALKNEAALFWSGKMLQFGLSSWKVAHLEAARKKRRGAKLADAKALLKECAHLMLLRDGMIDITVANEKYLPSLLAACAHGHEKVARLLLDEGADAGLAKANGWNCLMESCKSNHSNLIALLLDHGASINQAKADGWTPLHISCKEGRSNIVRTLLEQKAAVNQRTRDEWSALMIASKNGREEIVSMLLDAKASVQHARAQTGHNSLLAACQVGHAAIVRMLLNAKAAVDTMRDDDEQSGLMYTCRYGFVECAELLLDRNAQVDLNKANGWTALMAASQHGHVKCAKLLLERGADASSEKNDGTTALSLAEEHGRVDVAKILRKHLGLRVPPDPLTSSSIDGYPDGRSERAAVKLKKEAMAVKSASRQTRSPPRPKSAPTGR